MNPPTNDIKTNPIPKSTMDFPAAMRKVIDGNKITRLDESWKKDGIFGFLAKILTVSNRKGEIYEWRVSDADMHATDWIVVSMVN